MANGTATMILGSLSDFASCARLAADGIRRQADKQATMKRIPEREGELVTILDLLDKLILVVPNIYQLLICAS